MLQVAHVAVHLDALAQGAQGVLIQRAAGGDHVFVGRAEVFDLGLNLRQAFADHVEHVAAFGQLTLKAEHGQGITQWLALQGTWVAFEGADQRAVAFAQVDVVATIDFQRVLGVADQQAAEHAAQAGFVGLAGLGDPVHQHRGEKHAAQCRQLLLNRVHRAWPLLVHGSATSITPPPRQISPS
ncbi:hypothetical protein D3C84_665760 [compost metagenome]